MNFFFSRQFLKVFKEHKIFYISQKTLSSRNPKFLEIEVSWYFFYYNLNLSSFVLVLFAVWGIFKSFYHTLSYIQNTSLICQKKWSLTNNNEIWLQVQATTNQLYVRMSMFFKIYWSKISYSAIKWIMHELNWSN